MNDTEINAILERVRQIDNRTKSIEAAVNTILGILVITGVIVILLAWGIWPAIILALAAIIGTWAGRRAQRYAQNQLNKGISQHSPGT